MRRPRQAAVAICSIVVCLQRSRLALKYDHGYNFRGVQFLDPMAVQEAPPSTSCWRDEAGFRHNCDNTSFRGAATSLGAVQVEFFPRQCSMHVALERIMGSSGGPPMAREFYPLFDMTECNTPRQELDSILGQLFARPNDNRFAWSHWWGDDIVVRAQNGQTLGKKVDWYSKGALLAYLKGGDSASLSPPRPWIYQSNKTHWARHLHCAANATAWDCMFGNATLTSTKEITAEDPRMGAARKLWDMRQCITDKEKCWGAHPDHVKALLLGWTFRYVLPLNACRAYRLDCATNVVSLRNLDPLTISQRVFLSVHMRMGDACDRVETEERREPFSWGRNFKNRPCIAPAGYEAAIDRMSKMYGVTDILLASDSGAAFEWAKNWTTHDVHYLDIYRGRLDMHDKGWIELRKDIGHVEIDGGLQEWDFLGNGQLLIGGSCGKFTRVLYTIMVGRQNSVLPWVSVDGCQCFHKDGDVSTKDC